MSHLELSVAPERKPLSNNGRRRLVVRGDGPIDDVGPPVRPELLKRSVLGRPRAVSDAQIVRILEWYDSRLTLRQLAIELGVSTSTVSQVIRSRGHHYKQAGPEERAAALSAHRARRRKLRAGHWL